MSTVVFLPETMNLAETSRGVEVAKAAAGRWQPVFAGYGGPFAHLPEQAGFPFVPLEPAYTPDKIEHLWKVDRGKSFRAPFTVEELDARVRAELALYERVQPEVVFTGFDLTSYVSARVARLPLLVLFPFSATRPFFEAGLGGVPEALRRGPVRLLPRGPADAAFRRWALRSKALLGPLNTVAERHGLAPFPSLLRSWEGDQMLVADIPELTGVRHLPDGWRYVGPVYAHLPGDVPAQVLALDRDRPWVYCALGSSGTEEITRTVLRGLGELDVHVVAPVRGLLRDGAPLPPNVLALDWLPAHLVNPMCDIAVIHGGHGTVQTAIAAGTPFLGVGMQPEQDWNIDAVARWGAAVRLPKHRLRPADVTTAAQRLLTDKHKRARAEDLCKAYAAWDGPGRAADAVTEQLRR
jgi:UDP:flavonoid glycosyltransferase YjiC (YdhE family)